MERTNCGSTSKSSQTTQDPTFYFIHRILYLPSVGMPLQGKTIQLNNDDPAVSLDSRWKLGLPDANSNTTSQPGATAEIRFNGT